MERKPPIMKYVPITTPQKSIIIPGTCYKCYSKPSGEERLKGCGGCRIVSYCSKDCQKQNWSAHKNFCNVANELSDPGKNMYSSAEERIKNGENWFHFVMETFQFLDGLLDPKFSDIEATILNLPRVCEYCKCSESSALNLCKHCRAVYYCSDAHLESDYIEHKYVCSTLKLMVNCDELLAIKGFPEINGIPFTIKSVSKYEKLPSGLSNLIKIPSNLNDTIMSNWVSLPLTVLYALEKIGLGINSTSVHKAKKLTIHILDSSLASLRLHMSVTWECLFHLLPNLKRLRVVLIDPELIADFGVTASNNFQKTHSLCDDCEKSERKLTIDVEGQLRMYKRSDRYVRPDVIFTHRVRDSSTGHGIPHMAEPSIPMVIVGPTRESLEMNIKLLTEWEDDILLLPIQVNPFRGQRPMRIYKEIFKYMSQAEIPSSNSYIDAQTCFGYANSYICGMHRRMKDGQIRHRLTPNK